MKFIFNKKLVFNILIICLLAIFLLPQIILAASAGVDTVRAGLDITAGDKGANLDTTETDLSTIIGRTVGALFGVIGAIFLTVVLIGGFGWLTAGGSEEKVGKSKKLIINGINGIIVIFLAYALVSVILTAMSKAVGPAS